MEVLNIRITGISPLLMNKDTLANPLNPATKAHKELTNKRKKTDEDHEEIARSSFLASCYWNSTDGFHIPGQNFDAAFLDGAKLSRMGVHWKRGAAVVEDRVKLLFDGPGTPEKLWEDARFVDCRGVKQKAVKIMRYRPIFLKWSVAVSVAINDEVLNVSEAKKAILDAGKLIGIGDFRPRFGRFEVSYV